MKASLSDMIINYLMKGGILLETKGEFETEIDIPVEGEEKSDKSIKIKIKCNDLTIKTIKDNKGEA